MFKTGDAPGEGDAFPDAAAQGGSRDAELDQALSSASREGLSKHGVIYGKLRVL